MSEPSEPRAVLEERGDAFLEILEPRDLEEHSA